MFSRRRRPDDQGVDVKKHLVQPKALENAGFLLPGGGPGTGKLGQAKHTIYRGRPHPKNPRYSGFRGLPGVCCPRLQRLRSSVGLGARGREWRRTKVSGWSAFRRACGWSGLDWPPFAPAAPRRRFWWPRVVFSLRALFAVTNRPAGQDPQAVREDRQEPRPLQAEMREAHLHRGLVCSYRPTRGRIRQEVRPWWKARLPQSGRRASTHKDDNCYDVFTSQSAPAPGS